MATDTVVPTGTTRGAPRWLRNTGWYALLTGLSLMVLFPIWMLIVRALSNPTTYVFDRGQPPYPVDIEWDVFARAFDEADFGRQLAISVAATLVIVGGQLITSLLAAYAFAFLRFPFKRTLFAVCMATLMLPIEVTLVANSRTIRELEWLNSIQGLTVPFLATALGIFLIRQGFLGVPRDLRDAAALDGFGHLQFLWRVAIPLTRPVIAAFTVLSFLSAWNSYLWPRAVTDTSEWFTVQIGLRAVSNSTADELNVGAAAALLAALPVLIILILFQRHIVRGLTAGAVKG
ncbi:MAG: carbohydrate ABC transporter permease [Acidimicrobiia bacterium]|nr:carbohydrate ABC transporter permease [Acidimicrobiia bacterium]